MSLFDFPRLNQLPPYLFSITDELKQKELAAGADIVDMSMGNPDQPTPDPIVSKLVEAAQNGSNHRYSVSKGISDLREAVAGWYRTRYDVQLDPETETVVTMGSKEGLAHLVLGMIDRGDTVLCPDPCYPIHAYAAVIAGGTVQKIALNDESDFFENLHETYNRSECPPRLLMLNFPHNPTTKTVDLGFFENIVEFALEKQLLVIHDLAYADLCFDGYQAPSLLQVPQAKEIGVETFTLSKSYNMPGWRVGFCAGNSKMTNCLARVKSYLDYGMFQPIQLAAIEALTGSQDVVNEICEVYRERRDVLVGELNAIGWSVALPKATMFVWARIPEPFRDMGSLEFSKQLLKKAGVAVSPGIGFGEGGDEYVRFALIQPEGRTREATRRIGSFLDLKKDKENSSGLVTQKTGNL